MLILIFIYLLITLTCVASGFLVQGWITSKQQLDRRPLHWIVYACWGLITISVISQIAVLFIPLNKYSWPFFSLAVLIIYIAKKKRRLELYSLFSQVKLLTLPFTLSVCCACILVAVLSSGPTLMDDTDSYHIQMVKWIQEYGSPPGLANLHERYGFNSSWFSAVAFFVPVDTTRNFFTIVNSTLSLWLIVYLFQNVWGIEANSTSNYFIRLSSLLVLLAGLFCWPMLRGNATNINYDFVTAVFLLVLFIELLKENGTENWQKLLPELIIWPTFIFTIRIINYPYLLLSLFGVVQLVRYKKYSSVGMYMLVALLLIVPFLARNVMLSGYLFYPFYQFDIFQVDWKADEALAKEILTFIKYFNRVNAGFMPVEETAKLGNPGWIPVWFRYLFNYDKPILIGGVAGLLITPMLHSKWTRLSLPVKCFIVISLLQIVSWFIIAPDPRFIYGPLLIGLFLIPLLVLNKPWKSGSDNYMRSGIIFTATLMLGYAVTKAAHNENYLNPLLPVSLPSPATKSITIEHIQFHIPEKLSENWNPRCYATELPCLYDVQPGLKPRGRTIGDGFIIAK